MALQQEILNLLLKLKDKNLSQKEKNKIKAQLKKLYSKIKKITSKRVKITSPFKEEVKDILNPLKQTILTEKQKIKLFENSIKKEIKVLEEQRAIAVNPKELEQLSLLIKEKKEEIQLLQEAVKEGNQPSLIIQNVIEARNVNNKPDLESYVSNMIKRKLLDNPRIKKEDLLTQTKQAISSTFKRVSKLLNPDKKFNEAKNKRELDEFVIKQVDVVGLQLQAEAEQLAREQEARAKRKEQERLLREEQEALRELQMREEAQRKKDIAEAKKNLGIESKQAPTPKKKPQFRPGFWTDDIGREEAYGKERYGIKPVIIADFIELQLRAEQGTLPKADFEKFKEEMAQAISDMTPEEKEAIRFYTVSTQAKDLEPILRRAQEKIIQDSQQPDVEEVNRLATRDETGSFLNYLQLEDYAMTKGQGKSKSNYNYMPKKKVRGGAGVGDWAMALGSIPGLPQLLNNFGPFGQMLGQTAGLAQSFGKTAGQLAKEASKEGEKVAGFTGTLGDAKSMFGFGKKKRGGKMNMADMADMSGGAFSDFLGTIGKITPKIGGIVGAIPTYGKVGTIGNSFLGSASRVGEDIFKMLGLGNMDLSNQKGYGKKRGGRKMLPYDRPMPRDMGYILPYGLQAEPPIEISGGYDLADNLANTFFDFAGDAIKSGAKGLANAGLKIGKDLAKVGVQKIANKATEAIGNGRKRGRPKKCLNGCGKINGEYVSSEFQDEYERNLAKILNQKQMAQLQGERQLEQQIQRQMNVEQQSALAQLQYYDLLNKIQQARPQI